MNREGVTGRVNYVTTPQWVNHQPEEAPPRKTSSPKFRTEHVE
jgi:hypothetical protein